MRVMNCAYPQGTEDRHAHAVTSYHSLCSTDKHFNTVSVGASVAILKFLHENHLEIIVLHFQLTFNHFVKLSFLLLCKCMYLMIEIYHKK